MSWLFWNIRGIHQKDSKNHVKDLLRAHDIHCLILLEPKASHAELPSFAFSMGFTSWSHDADVNSHMWLLWKRRVKNLFSSSQALTVDMICLDNNKMIISWVYASCLKRIRQEL